MRCTHQPSLSMATRSASDAWLVTINNKVEWLRFNVTHWSERGSKSQVKHSGIIIFSRVTLSGLKYRQAWWRQRAVSSVDDTAANQKTNSRWKSCKAHKHRGLFAKHRAKPSPWLGAWSPLPKDQSTDTWPTQHGDNRVGLVWRHMRALCRHSHKLVAGLELCWRYGCTQTHFDSIRMHVGSINPWRAAGRAGKFAYYNRAKSWSWQRGMCSPSAILVKFRFLKDISNRKFKRKFWLNIAGCFGNLSQLKENFFRVCDCEDAQFESFLTGEQNKTTTLLDNH